MVEFEFSNTKQIRKTILIISLAGICFKVLVNNSTGNIEFLGFKIPIENANIVPQLIGCVIVFEIMALIIRYFEEDVKLKYEKYEEIIEKLRISDSNINKIEEFAIRSLKPSFKKVSIIKKSVFFLEIVFPIIFGIGTFIYMFYF